MTVRRALTSLVVSMLALSAAPMAPVAADAAPPDGCAEIPAWAPAAVSSGTTALGEHLVEMSDGTKIALDVTLPAGVEGPFPAVVTITGYGKSGAVPVGGGGMSAHGYAVVSIDDRGTGASGGQWDAWGARTRADYAEVLDWVVAQPWSDGSLGIDGMSYGGITALFAAATGHPAVKAVFATVPMGDAYRDITFAGGQVNAAFIPLWMGLVTGLGIVNAGQQPEALLDHIIGLPGFQLSTITQALTGGEAAFDGPFWRQRSPIEAVEDISAPTFIVGGLDDIFQRGEPLLYEALADHTDARLVIGPWAHITATQGLPADGVPSVGAMKLQWFDEHVKGVDAGASCVPQVLQYVRGVDEWRAAPSWPVPDLTARRWFLHGDATLSSEEPAAGGGGRDYLQLPLTGLCTRSANQWLIGALTGSSCETDNRLDESLPGALTYTSEPLSEPLYVNGPIQADIWLRPTTDQALVSVAVSDVAPDGTSRGLTNGLLTASHRAIDPERARMLDDQSIQPWHPFGRTDVLPVRPGEAIHVPVEVFPTAAVLEPGHSLRITIAAYDVPHALPPLPDLVGTLGGPVTVLSDAEHPSSVVFPVVGDPAVDVAGSGADGASGGPAAAEPESAPAGAGEAGGAAAAGSDDDGPDVLGQVAAASAQGAPGRPGLPATGTSVPILGAGTAVGLALWLRSRARKGSPAAG